MSLGVDGVGVPGVCARVRVRIPRSTPWRREGGSSPQPACVGRAPPPTKVASPKHTHAIGAPLPEPARSPRLPPLNSNNLPSPSPLAPPHPRDSPTRTPSPSRKLPLRMHALLRDCAKGTGDAPSALHVNHLAGQPLGSAYDLCMTPARQSLTVDITSPDSHSCSERTSSTTSSLALSPVALAPAASSDSANICATWMLVMRGTP